jgi:hypothetical protein
MKQEKSLQDPSGYLWDILSSPPQSISCDKSIDPQVVLLPYRSEISEPFHTKLGASGDLPRSALTSIVVAGLPTTHHTFDLQL